MSRLFCTFFQTQIVGTVALSRFQSFHKSSLVQGKNSQLAKANRIRQR